LAITSLAFMFVEVPAPPWMKSVMNCSSMSPAITRSAPFMIASAIFLSRTPRSRLAMAAAFFTYPKAFTKYGSRDIGMPVMWKFSLPRSVCTP
jgi:hypothetical protein